MDNTSLEQRVNGVLVVRQAPRPPFLNRHDLFVEAVFHKKVLASSFLGLVLIATLASFVIPQQYESEAKILIKHQRVDPVVTPGAEQIPPHEYGISPEELNSEAELVRTDDLFRKVVLMCALARPAREPVAQEQNIVSAIVQLRSKLKVEVLPKTNMLSVSYLSPSPDLSARVVEAAVNAYLEKHVAVHSSSELGFFDEQVAKYSDELREAEATLKQFSQSNSGAVTPQAQRDSLLQRQNEFEAQLEQTRSELRETRARLEMLDTEAQRAPDRVTTQMRNLDNPQLMQDLKATLLRLELKRTDLVSKYKPTYPSVLELDQEIVAAKAALSAAEGSPLRDQTTDVNPVRQWIDSESAKSRTQLQALDSRVVNLSRTVDSYKRQARSMDQLQLQYADLVRHAKSAEDNYLLYTRKREEARITNALDQSRILNVAVIQPATRTNIPTRSRASYLLIGLGLATTLTLGLLFTFAQADNTFRTPEELEAFVQLPVLATVPVVPPIGRLETKRLEEHN